MVNESSNLFIRSLLKKQTGILREMQEYALEHHVPIIQPETAALLKVAGLLKKPLRILEIGTAIGYSAIIMSSFIQPGGRIDTIERYEKMADIACENIIKAGLQNIIKVIRGEAADVLACLEKEYDMIFLDAAKGQYPEFLPDCLRLLSKGGLLVSDNVLYKGMVSGAEGAERRKKTIVVRLRQYLEELCNNPELETGILPVGDGVALSYKRIPERLEQGEI